MGGKRWREIRGKAGNLGRQHRSRWKIKKNGVSGRKGKCRKESVRN